MSPNDEELLRRLRALFRVEAQEHAQSIASGLIELERASPSEAGADVLDRVFRAAHSLKGAARAVNVTGVESLCQSLESVFAALRRRAVAPSAGLFDLLQRAAAALSRSIEAADDPTQAAPASEIGALRQALHAALALPQPAEPKEADEPVRSTGPERGPTMPAQVLKPWSDSVRVRTRTLDGVLLQSEELLFAKLAAMQRADALRRLQKRPWEWRRRWTELRPDLRSVAAVIDRGGEVDAAVRSSWRRVQDYVESSQDFTATLDSDLLRLSKAAEQEQRVVGAMVEQLLDQMKQVAVQPFSAVLDLFAPSVREMSRERGKEVDLSIHGADIEIDRRVLEAIKDPLIHLVRNSIDHGIEEPAARRLKGKPARGRLCIEVKQASGNQVEVVVSDDGAGFDKEALERAAARAGIPPAADGGLRSAQETLALACEPGVSTSPLITDLSGRGLGLSIVKEQVERLAGTLSLETARDQGASFRMILPLTLARFRGVVVRLGQQLFVLPTRNVERVTRVGPEDIKTVENRETISIAGRALGLARLDSVLGLPPPQDVANDVRFAIVVLAQGQQSIAFRVDEVVDEREVLVKPLGRQLQRVRHFAGATVIGSGRAVPILHVPDLLRSAVAGATGPVAVPRNGPDQVPRKSVLVAEDSITSRTLLKGILEGAGYRVETAADGIDAFTALRSGRFDVVVSDVDMPRLNGFGLTARIRADKNLAELPVILVTALESREDREHGIDVGASAYLVKSSFDQSNLLDIVRRLS